MKLLIILHLSGLFSFVYELYACRIIRACAPSYLPGYKYECDRKSVYFDITPTCIFSGVS
jgi:hypothetical protein